MTRETKLGLAVALAFLALVGGVLGVKLMQGDGPATGDGSQPVANGTPDDAAKTQPAPAVASAPSQPPTQATGSQPANPVMTTGATTTAGPDEQKPSSAMKQDSDAVSATFTTNGAAPTAPAALPVTTPPMTPPVTPPVTEPATSTPPMTDAPPQPEAPKPSDPFATPPPPGPKPGPVPPLESPKQEPEVRNEKPKPAPIVLPSGGSIGDAGSSASAPAAAPLTAPPTVMAPPVTGLTETNSSNMTNATPSRPDSAGGGLSDAGAAVQPPATISRPTTTVTGTNDTVAGSMTPAIAVPAPPAPAAVGSSPPNSVTFEKPAGSTGTLTTPTSPTFTAPRSPETLAPEVRTAPSVRIEPADPWRNGGTGNVAAVGLAPPSGATGVVVQAPAAGPPPLVKPVAPGGPKAQSYLVEEYRLQAGDNFDRLSQKFYFSPKYAAALQAYNQNEPLAAPGLRANPPMLSVGQVVWMPPARILERDYGEMISGLQPLPADRGAPGMTTAVRPVTPTGPILYKVRARGESLREIARHTLNDSNQWLQVYNLNTNVKPQPEIPIAPGTILRLPPEAKIDPTDRP
jgi:hypothetical protein